jgi:murein L,D-transpeptidase YafK
MNKFASSPWIKFWKTLEPAYSIFEKSKQIPEVAVTNGEYVVSTRNTQLAMRQLTGQAK